MGYTKSSVKRAQDNTGDEILTYLKNSGEHIQAVTNIPVQDINDMEEIGTITYVGIEDANAEWTIKKIDETSTMSIRYATIINNPIHTTYSSAWNSRASLVYEHYSSLF